MSWLRKAAKNNTYSDEDPNLIKFCHHTLFAFICALIASSTHAFLPEHSPVPGGIAVLAIANASEQAPKASFEGAPVMVIARERSWLAIVGIPLSAEVGTHQLRIEQAPNSAFLLNFDVEDKNYKTQRLTIPNKRKVNPEKRDMARIEADYLAITAAKKAFTPQENQTLLLEWPVKGRISSIFGLRRILNDQPRNPHSGLDIAAPTGTPILAPADGKVIEVGDFFFNGKTVFVDHGNGLVTMYCHMDEMDVEVGATVATGELLGKVGETGRVTGPHLHLGVLLNGNLVDPNLLLRIDQ